MRASGPTRATSGSFSCSERYCFSEASVSIDMAHSRGRISRSSNRVGPVSKKSLRLPLASTSHSRVFLPRSAASRANAAAMVVLPTPPLPVTKISLRSRRSGAEGTNQKRRPVTRSAGGEADPPFFGRTAELHVGDLVGRDADPPTAAVGEPEHSLASGQRRFDILHDLIAVSVVAELDLDLLRRLGDTNANVHELPLLLVLGCFPDHTSGELRCSLSLGPCLGFAGPLVPSPPAGGAAHEDQVPQA